VDASLRQIGQLEWPGADRHGRIEEYLMSQYVTVPSAIPASGRRRRLAGWVGAGALLASGLVYGSVRLYERYIVNVNVNGVDHIKAVEPGPDGTALIEVPTPNGGKARILVGPENMGPDGVIRAGVIIRSENDKPGELAVDGATVGPIKQVDPADLDQPLPNEDDKPKPKKKDQPGS
jgi:hypothetical protein